MRLPTKEPHGARRQEASGRGPDRTKPPTDPNQVSRPQHRPRNQQPSTRSATGPETNSLGSKEAINNNPLQKRKCIELITESQGPSHTTPNRPKSKTPQAAENSGRHRHGTLRSKRPATWPEVQPVPRPRETTKVAEASRSHPHKPCIIPKGRRTSEIIEKVKMESNNKVQNNQTLKQRLSANSQPNGPNSQASDHGPRRGPPAQDTPTSNLQRRAMPSISLVMANAPDLDENGTKQMPKTKYGAS